MANPALLPSILLRGSETIATDSRIAPTLSASTKNGRRRISAPFDLRANMDILNQPQNRAFFDATFPGNEGYADDGLFLYVYLNTPPEPLPKSFAGVPVVFVSPEEERFPPLPPFVLPWGTMVPLQQCSIVDYLDYRHNQSADWKPLFDAIRLHFDNIKVSITEVIYWGYFVHIVLENEDTTMTGLPSRAGRIVCRYLYEKDMKRPVLLQAQCRAKDLTKDGVIDDSSYDVLQPGVLVSSNYIPGSQASWLTTLGAQVWDGEENTYITVASHGFPESCGVNVFHGLRESRRLVGQLAGRVGTTDVGLMRLSEGERFHNETFARDTTDSEASLICGLRSPQRFDVVSLNSPFTGHLDGQIMALAYKKIPSDGETDEHYWVAVDWIYRGPDGDMLRFPDSMCGTVVCDEDNKVVSFFQYAFVEGPWKGWCVGTSASELLEQGFR